ncbi:MAG: S9 family peptidase, partial [Candidatus Eremiobacteraeota bacterium]|nr:S9 family peptidase [Candidatus Eremiobacteraeota bacterium]
YLKQAPTANSEKLYVRRRSGGAERVLVDPDKIAAATSGKHYTINYFTPSLDGSHVAYGISEGGSENAVIHVVSATGQELPDQIDRALFVGVTSWLPDGKSFYYVRFPQLKPGEPETMKETRAVNYLHVLGRDPSRDPAVFGYNVNSGVRFDLTDFPIVEYSEATHRTYGVIAHGVKNELDVFLATSPVNSPDARWKQIATSADDVTSIADAGNTIYFLTHKAASSFKVVASTVASPNVNSGRVVIPAGKEVIEALSPAADGMYVQSREGGFGRIRKYALTPAGMVSGKIVPVLLPFQGTIAEFATDPTVPGAVFALTSWTRSSQIYRVNPTGGVTNTNLKPVAPVDMSGYTSTEVQAKSQDGTMVPLSIVYKKGIALDGSHPTYLEGYGSYGIVINPSFSTTRLAWLERGAVFAVCHVRGSGWYGEDWHRAGMIATKHHTWEDFVGCGQYLIDHKYTSPEHLAGEGTSAGGITIGRAITSRPDLFAAALDVVGSSNALRSEFTPNGPPNIPEFGTVKDETGFKALADMDAYQHVVKGTKYPAVMLITGYNDPRVSSWELAKMTAALQAATTSGRPILLRVDYDAGHGFLAASRKQSEELLTDEYSFLLWQTQDPAFAAIPTHVFKYGS